jgi:hypothetical protein
MDGLVVIGNKCQMVVRPTKQTTQSVNTFLVLDETVESRNTFVPEKPYSLEELNAMLPGAKYQSEKPKPSN